MKKLNNFADIIPFKSAGGIILGTNINNFLELAFDKETYIYARKTDILFETKYNLAFNVDIFNGNIFSITLYDNYEGKLFGKFGIGSKISDLLIYDNSFKYNDDENFYYSNNGLLIAPIFSEKTNEEFINEIEIISEKYIDFERHNPYYLEKLNIEFLTIDSNKPINPLEGAGGINFQTNIKNLYKIISSFTLSKGQYIEKGLVYYETNMGLGFTIDILSSKIVNFKIFGKYKGKLSGGYGIGDLINKLLENNNNYEKNGDKIIYKDLGLVIKVENKKIKFIYLVEGKDINLNLLNRLVIGEYTM